MTSDDQRRESWLGSQSNAPIQTNSGRKISSTWRSCKSCDFTGWIDFESPVSQSEAHSTPCPECKSSPNSPDRKVDGWGNQPLWKASGMSESQFNKLRLGK